MGSSKCQNEEQKSSLVDSNGSEKTSFQHLSFVQKWKEIRIRTHDLDLSHRISLVYFVFIAGFSIYTERLC